MFFSLNTSKYLDKPSFPSPFLSLHLTLSPWLENTKPLLWTPVRGKSLFLCAAGLCRQIPDLKELCQFISGRAHGHNYAEKAALQYGPMLLIGHYLYAAETKIA